MDAAQNRSVEIPLSRQPIGNIFLVVLFFGLAGFALYMGLVRQG